MPSARTEARPLRSPERGQEAPGTGARPACPAMPPGHAPRLLWVLLAVWGARGDLPFVAENEAALTVDW